LPPAGAPERARTDAAVRDLRMRLQPELQVRGVQPSAVRQGTGAKDCLTRWIKPLQELTCGPPNVRCGGSFSIPSNGSRFCLRLGSWAGSVCWPPWATFQMPVPEVPRTEGWPWPTFMVAGGVALGIALPLPEVFLADGRHGLGRRGAAKRLKGRRGSGCRAADRGARGRGDYSPESV
jgi:hypothetical protein